MLDSLLATRASLAQEVISLDTADDVLQWQLKIADAISDVERAGRLRDDECSWHIHLLRHLVDTLIWRFLPVHTIRQQYKLPPQRVDIACQAGWAHTVWAARGLAAQGTFVFFADLSHCLRQADLVCLNDDGVHWIECKASFRLLDSPRGRRQLEKLARLRDYLNSDSWRSGRMRLRAIDLNHRTQHSWDTLDKGVQEALANGSAVLKCDDSDVLVAFRRDVSITEALTRAPAHVIPIERKGIIVQGFSVRPYNDLDTLAPPALLCPINSAARHALFEQTVIVGHIFSLTRLMDRIRDLGICDIVECLRGGPFIGAVRYDGQMIYLPWEWSNRICYCHETIDSVVAVVKELLTSGYIDPTTQIIT